jgi:hypothetical protein
MLRVACQSATTHCLQLSHAPNCVLGLKRSGVFCEDLLKYADVYYAVTTFQMNIIVFFFVNELIAM